MPGWDPTRLRRRSRRQAQVGEGASADDLAELGEFESLIRPLRPEVASPEALAVNGRSLAELAGQPHPAEVLGRFVDFACAPGGPVVVVGHNVGFDLEFLRREEATYGLALPRHDGAIDTCALARVHLEARGVIANSKLATVAAHYGIEFQAHDALGDVRATARILERFKGEAPVLVDRAIEGNLLSGLLADAEAAQPGSPFVASVSGQYSRKGWLSSKQISALVKIAAEGSAGDRRGVVALRS